MELYKLLAEKHSLSAASVKKYLEMTEEEIKIMDNPKKYKKRKNFTDGYQNMIYKMIRDGIDPYIIKAYVIMKGYKGTDRALEACIERYAKNNFGIILNRGSFKELSYPPGTVIIKRRDILKYITVKNDEDKDETIANYFHQITEKYPIVKKCQEIYDEFHSIIMGSDPDKIDKFISDHLVESSADDDIEDIDSGISGFAASIKKDIHPIKNAISFSESSGFVEGNNNKFKLVKRILYGRANLVNLFRKSYLVFRFDKPDFDITSIIDHKIRKAGIVCNS